jgi:carbamoylphosphate synthase large subunit
LGVVGLMNVQFAVQDGVVYVLEVNPRASRTVPFVSKATSVPLAKVGARAMAGISLQTQGIEKEVIPDFYSGERSRVPVYQIPRRRHHSRPRNALHRRSDGRGPAVQGMRHMDHLDVISVQEMHAQLALA